MKKLIGSRKQRVNELGLEYLAYKELADQALERLKEELKNEEECETDALRIKYKGVTRRTFDKKAFIEKYGQEAYDACLVSSSYRRFDLKRKK